MKNNFYAVAVLALALSACGNDKGEGVASPASTIQIAPSAIEHAYRGDQITGINSAGGFEDFVTVTVLNSSGNPIKNAQVRMFHLGPGTMADINRVLQSEPYITTTDDFGNIYLYIYTGAFNNVGDTSTDFEAFSGSAFQAMTVTMTCTDMQTSTQAICD